MAAARFRHHDTHHRMLLVLRALPLRFRGCAWDFRVDLKFRVCGVGIKVGLLGSSIREVCSRLLRFDKSAFRILST